MNPHKLNSRDRYKVKYCPCGKSNKDGKFVPFIGYDQYGYCHSCTRLFSVEEGHRNICSSIPSRKQDHKEYIYIPSSKVNDSIQEDKSNNFIDFLIKAFGLKATIKLKEEYVIGTSDLWNHATIFWYIDECRRVCSGKIMNYDATTGKRVQLPGKNVSWVHHQLNIPADRIAKCLFGLPLINRYPKKSVAVVESEKTAIIASHFFPQFIWLASGGVSNLSFEKLKPLSGRKIILFPDIGAYENWNEKVINYSSYFNIRVSDFLERNASQSDRKYKLDLADFLLRMDIANSEY